MLLFADTILEEFEQAGTSYGDILTNIGNAFKKGVTNAAETTLSTLTAMEDSAKKLNRTITSGIVVGSNQLRESLISSYKETVKFGGSFTDLTDVVENLNSDMGKMTLPSIAATEQMVALTKTTGIASKEMGKLEGSFVRLLKSQTKSAEKMAEIAKIARQSGLDAAKLLEGVNKNLQLVDAYAFKGGVDGLTQMTAKAQSLNVELGDIVSEQTMDNLLDPEKAIEMAQTLSMIGGFGSDLTNFTQILNAGRNDVGKLQDSFINLAQSAFKVNDATGEITIDALQRDRLKASVEAINGDYKKFIQIGREAAKQKFISDKMLAQGVDISGIPQESMNLVKSLTEIGEGGKLELRIPGFETTDLVKSIGDNPKALQAALEEYQNKAKLSDRMLAEKSLTVEETQQKDMRIIRDYLLTNLTDTERQTAIDAVLKSAEVFDKVGDIQKESGSLVSEARKDFNNVSARIQAQKQEIVDNKPTTFDAPFQTNIEATNLKKEDAFFGEGKKVLSLGKGQMFDFIKDDQAMFAPDLDKKIGLLKDVYLQSQNLSDNIPTLEIKEPTLRPIPPQEIVTKSETTQNTKQTIDNNFNISVDLNVKGLTSGPIADMLSRDAEFQRNLKDKVMEIFSQRNLLSKSKSRFES
jgi:hypothetical protein